MIGLPLQLEQLSRIVAEHPFHEARLDPALAADAPKKDEKKAEK